MKSGEMQLKEHLSICREYINSSCSHHLQPIPAGIKAAEPTYKPQKEYA